MELFVKHFSELTAQELYEIYRLRVSVFVVEQKCCYQEVDDADENAYHVWLRDKDGIEAYARVLPRGATSGGFHRPRDRREAALQSGEANRRRGHRHGDGEAARR